MGDCKTCAYYLGWYQGYHRCQNYQHGVRAGCVQHRYEANAVETGLPPHWRFSCTASQCPEYCTSRAGTIETGPLPLEGDECGK